MSNTEHREWLRKVSEDGYRTDGERRAAVVLMEMLAREPAPQPLLQRATHGPLAPGVTCRSGWCASCHEIRQQRLKIESSPR